MDENCISIRLNINGIKKCNSVRSCILNFLSVLLTKRQKLHLFFLALILGSVSYPILS